MIEQLKIKIEKAWEQKELLKNKDTQDAIRQVIELLDKGKVRVSEPIFKNNSEEIERWELHQWVKKAVLMYFPIQK